MSLDRVPGVFCALCSIVVSAYPRTDRLNGQSSFGRLLRLCRRRKRRNSNWAGSRFCDSHAREPAATAVNKLCGDSNNNRTDSGAARGGDRSRTKNRFWRRLEKVYSPLVRTAPGHLHYQPRVRLLGRRRRCGMAVWKECCQEVLWIFGGNCGREEGRRRKEEKTKIVDHQETQRLSGRG